MYPAGRDNFNDVIRECLIDGKILRYDICTSGMGMSEAKEYFAFKYKYIGSSFTYFINKHEGKNPTLTHYFVKCDNKNMKDYLGNDLYEGCNVVLMDIHYKSFVKGIITKISKVKITIKYTSGKLINKTTIRFPEQLILC